MNNLFNEFESTNYTDWLEKIEVDLKGKPLTVLASNPEPDLEIVAYHHSETTPEIEENSYARNLTRKNNDWSIRQIYHTGKDAKSNASILSALNQGINHIGLTVDDTTDFKKLTDGIMFQHIYSDIHFTSKAAAHKHIDSFETNLNFDIIGQNAVNGEWDLTMADFGTFFNKNKESKKCWVGGYHYGAAGASTIQEIAFTANHINEYIHFLQSEGKSLTEINQNLVLELSVNDNYFVNIAKFRVIRQMVQLLFEGYDSNYESLPVLVYAKTNIRYLSKNDSNNNPLRETTQAMSAVMGGCDVLTVDFGMFGDELTTNRFERIAKNIQLILKEEAYLDKVVDPSAGSYYIESLTNQIMEKSWDLFLKIENGGGLIQNLKTNQIQEIIATNKTALIENLNTKKSTFLGINKFPNGMENWIDLEIPKTDNGVTEFKPLTPFYLEDYYIKEEVK